MCYWRAVMKRLTNFRVPWIVEETLWLCVQLWVSQEGLDSLKFRIFKPLWMKPEKIGQTTNFCLSLSFCSSSLCELDRTHTHTHVHIFTTPHTLTANSIRSSVMGCGENPSSSVLWTSLFLLHVTSNGHSTLQTESGNSWLETFFLQR
jgi:hypothetical protein